MIFVAVPHPENELLRALLCGTVEAGDPVIKHFYLERRDGPKAAWVRTRKIKAGLMKKYMKRFKFDEIEAVFCFEDSAEKYMEEREV